MAFGKPPVKPKPLGNTYSGTNGALAAATKVGGASRPGHISRQSSMSRLETAADDLRLLHQRSGGSNTGTSDGDRRLNHLDPSTGFLQRPEQAGGGAKSPSFIAAALAASRSVTPNHTGPQNQHLSAAQQQQLSAALQKQSSFTRRRSPGSIRSVSSRGSLDQPLDTSSIAPTTSLIGMFEQNSKPQTVKKAVARRTETDDKQTEPTRPKRTSPVRARTPSPRIVKASRQEIRSPKPAIRAPSPQPEKTQKTRKPEIKSPKPTLPPTFMDKPIETTKLSPSPRKTPPMTDKPDPPKQVQAVRKPSLPNTKPIPIPPKTRYPKEQPPPDDDASSEDSFVSAPEYRPSFRAELRSQSNRRLESSSSPSLSQVSSNRAAINSLANAIVASSLASSRAASPSRSSLAPPPPPRRNHLFHHGRDGDISRTPSPAKPSVLRTTMRKPREEEEDEGEKRRGKKTHLMKKHPNKHHEGDRKRWRDVITERERKRYEAVWASNKGLYNSERGEENGVNNLVVRDIFSRSRLHSDVLEEVYNLVDRSGSGVLRKEEFVVGLWLVDQRLKGRKLPIRVQDSVWRSVGSSGGIKVKNAGK